MKGRGARLSLGAALLALACGGTEAPERIVLVTIDTLRADRVGGYGEGARTPRMDAVTARGARFAVAISPAPITLPAHATLMTGLDPPAHGVRHNSVHRLGEDLPTLAEGLAAEGYATAAFVGAVVLDAAFGLDRGFGVYDDRIGGERRTATTGFAERTADQVVDAALGWLAGAPDRFFLWVHLYDPHRSWEPPPGFASAFASDPYRGEIAFADAELGRLLDAVDQRWPAADTAVVVTSDHGESLGEHGELTHAYTIYEATQRVPLLLAGPGVPAGTVVEEPVGLLDLAPTLLAWAGAGALPGSPGRDLRELFADGPSEPRDLYMETLATQLDFEWSPLLGLRVGPVKYIRAPRPELYRLDTDPGETRDLAAERPARVSELDARLEALLAGSGRPPETVALGEEQRARLRSLGYVVPGEATPAGLGRVGGPDPKDEMALLGALGEAQIDIHEGRHAEALERLDAIDSTAPQVRAHRAVAALGAGQAARAVREARAVVEADPGRDTLRVVLAQSLMSLERDREAERVLSALPVDAAPHPWVALSAARGDLAAGDRERAMARLAAARERFAEAPRLALAHGQLLEQAGRPDEARAAFAAGLAAGDDPDAPGLAEELRRRLAALPPGG